MGKWVTEQLCTELLGVGLDRRVHDKEDLNQLGGEVRIADVMK